jgi:hypothetical protein
MAGAAEILAQNRRLKKEYAERYAQAQQKYIKRVFYGKHLPQLVRIAEGVCVGIDIPGGKITVRLNQLAVDLQAIMPSQPIAVQWDRPRLTSRDVLNKRVKVFIYYRGGADDEYASASNFVLAAIMS